MKPQKQLFRHRPEDGVYGDCHRTAIAIVLDLDAADVPHFMSQEAWASGSDAAWDRVEAWLNARGISSINVFFEGTAAVEEILATVARTNPRGRPAFILGGTSRNGTNHSVVCCDGKIVCDPSQDDSGIVGPCEDGFYWLTFFGHLDATANPFRRSPVVAIERERLEDAAQALRRTLENGYASSESFSIAIGAGELHIHVRRPEVAWDAPKPAEVNGYAIDWHWSGDATEATESAA